MSKHIINFPRQQLGDYIRAVEAHPELELIVGRPGRVPVCIETDGGLWLTLPERHYPMDLSEFWRTFRTLNAKKWEKR